MKALPALLLILAGCAASGSGSAPGTLRGTVRWTLSAPGREAGPLANVFVYVKTGLEGRTFPVPAEPVVLDQVTFQFVPRVFGIRVGQTLRITSQDSSQHNVFCQPFVNPGFNEGMFAGEIVEKKFTAREVMIPFQCNIHHIMKAYAGVLDHPFFAVTGRDGTFEFRGLPAGAYEIEAWQEDRGSRRGTVTLDAGGTVSLDFSYP